MTPPPSFPRGGRALLIGSLVGLAWSNRFVQDDAFISFRYAANWVAGHGLVWNVGERVEGYTNFLWTAVIAAALWAGAEPVAAAQAIGLCALVVSLVATDRLARELGPAPLAVLAVVLLGTNYSFSAYATGGLETSLQTALFAAAWAQLAAMVSSEASFRLGRIALSLTAALAVLTRLDSAVVMGPVLLAAALSTWRRSTGARAWLLGQLEIVVPFAVVVGLWLSWKWQFYGDLLPNTFYVKVGASATRSGLRYVWRFLSSYGLWPVPLLGLIAWWRSRRSAPNQAIAFSIGTLLLWVGYVVRVGGDFMEFRFLVPVLPLFLLGAAATILTLARSTWSRGALALLLIGGSAHHALTFSLRPSDNIEPIAELSRHVRRPVRGWINLGRRLGALFPEDSGVMIAVTAAGAIPYYSRLPTLDMLGLSDRWIAREGPVLKGWVGHGRITTYRYLAARRVNLVLAHPYVTDDGPTEGPLLGLRDWATFASEIPDPESLIDPVRLVEIPIAPGRWLRALYLTRHPAVDSSIAEGGWPVHVLVRDGRPAAVGAGS